MTVRIRCVSLVLALLVFSAAAAFAQTSTSRITGTVTDPSGAVVPGASVTAINEATGVTYSQVTTEGGVYAFPSLPLGAYTIKVELSGFKTAQNKGNILEINTPLVVNVHLQVGGTSEVVSVIGDYQKLETTSAQIGNTIEQKAIESLPLNGRNPLSLLTLEPGVVQRSYGGAGSGMHVNGSRDRAYNVTIDGIDANESSVPNPMSNVYRLNPDNVQEFRTITSNATAEQGRNSGANIAIATRQGTNDFHANFYEFFRNTALNSNEFYANSMAAKDAKGKAMRPDIKMNQFGIEGGGPIIKNKTFFFAGYQNQRINTTQPIDQTYGLPTLYTPTALSGTFRYWVADPKVPFIYAGQTITRNNPILVDTATGALKPDVPVCSATVTTNCVASYNIFANDPQGIGADPKIMAIFKSYPIPNNYALSGDGLNTATYYWSPPAKFQGPNILARVDHAFNENNHVFVRYMFADYNTLKGDPLNGRPMVFPGFTPLGEVFRRTQGLAANYRRVISPKMVNEFTMGFSRFQYLFTQGEANPSWPDVGPYSFANVTYPYLNTPRTYRAVTTPQFVDNFSILHGKHVFAMGFNIRLYEHNDERGQPGGTNVTPTLNFASTYRTPPGFTTPSVASSTRAGIYSTDSTTLLGAINDLIGIPSRLYQNFLGNLTADIFLPYKTGNSVTMWAEGHRLKQFNFYFQDEWKVRPNITVNYGLRWEINMAPTEAGGRVYLPDKPVTSSDGVTFVHADSWLKTNNLGALGPRLAIAWSPRNDPKLVVRAGYGIYYDPLNSFMVTSVSGKIPGLVTTCTAVVGGTTSPSGCVAPPDLRINQGFPLQLSPPTTKPSSFLTLPASLYGSAPSLVTLDPYMGLPTVHQWNLSIQRELPGGFVAQAAYVGHRGTHLMRIYNINQINGDAVIPSFLIMQANYNAGCQPDGTGCPAGVTGTPVPIVANGSIPSSLVSTVINSSTTKGYLPTNNVGAFAYRIESNTLNLHLRPNQQFSTISYIDSGGDSYYHALQTTLRKRFEKGLMLGVAYTFGKSIDDQSIDPVGASSGGGYSATAARYAVDSRNWRGERGRSDFDRTHVLSVNALWELPVGKGKWLGSNFKGPLDAILGGWSVNGISTYETGEPFSVMSGVYTSNYGHTSRAALVGAMPKMELVQLPGVIGPSFFKDSSAFTYPAVGSNGMGRNLFTAQPYYNLDLGITKNFSLTERVKMNFRMEMFNALNHPNFDNPRDASTGSPTFTSSVFAQACCQTVAPPATQTIIQTGESARIIQFALKISF